MYRLTIIESDLFREIPSQQFDIIAINPPYYKKTPKNRSTLHGFAARMGNISSILFRGLNAYMHPNDRNTDGII